MTELVFILYTIAQKYLCKKRRKLDVTIVDFKTAFDSVHHGKLLSTLQEEGIKGRCLLRNEGHLHFPSVRGTGDYSGDMFRYPKGVRQGCLEALSLLH